MRCVAFRPLTRGTLIGFADLELTGGIRVLDCTVHESNGKRWVSPPAKPALASDRRSIKIENGKPVYVPVIDFPSVDVRHHWSEAAVEAVERFRRREAERQLYGPPQSKTPPTARPEEVR